MEIDLIDNVPCSHCEQLVPCEHNPETSSKNFPPQTFNPSSSFCPSLQKMKRGDAREDKILSCQVPAKQVEMWSKGDGHKDQEASKEGQKRQRAGARTDALRGREDWPKQLSYPPPENPLLSSVSNRKYLILVLRGLRRHDYTLPTSPARRGGIWPIRPPLRVTRGLAST